MGHVFPTNFSQHFFTLLIYLILDLAPPSSFTLEEDHEVSFQFVSDHEGDANGDFNLGMYINLCYISFLIRVCNYDFDC